VIPIDQGRRKPALVDSYPQSAPLTAGSDLERSADIKPAKQLQQKENLLLHLLYEMVKADEWSGDCSTTSYVIAC
jgi:hypothetical protein